MLRQYPDLDGARVEPVGGHDLFLAGETSSFRSKSRISLKYFYTTPISNVDFAFNLAVDDKFFTAKRSLIN
jgi:hypothetical protein